MQKAGFLTKQVFSPRGLLSLRFSTYTDILSKEEEEEINREKNKRDSAFSLLAKRENELALIRDGEITSAKKPKSTNFTKSVAFKNYMKMYYNKPKPTVSEIRMQHVMWLHYLLSAIKNNYMEGSGSATIK